MNAKTTVTAQQIVSHRATRKATGMMGCLLSGVEDAPLMSLRGICWRVDAKGRFAGNPDFDPKDPGCFCFDCRGMFDPDGTVDAELVNDRHPRAWWVYEDLLPQAERPAKPENPPASPEPDDANEDYSTCLGFSNEVVEKPRLKQS